MGTLLLELGSLLLEEDGGIAPHRPCLLPLLQPPLWGQQVLPHRAYWDSKTPCPVDLETVIFEKQNRYVWGSVTRSVFDGEEMLSDRGRSLVTGV